MLGADRRSVAILGGLLVLVVAGVFTSVATPAPHTGGDNAGYLSLAHALTSGAGYTELWDPASPPHTKYPPVFPATLGLLILTGATGWLAFKLLMALLMSLAVLLVFAWIVERSGPLPALAVALVTLFSAGWLQASRWVLSEPLFLVFTFLCLWAMERADVTQRSRDGPDPPKASGSSPIWMWVAGFAAILAFFTRSAGLPLILALGAAFLLDRRFRAFGVFSVGSFVLGLPWLLRVRAGGEGAYQPEFWMVNPYEPQLGTIQWTDLPARAWTNARLYVGEVLPGEWWGGSEGATLEILGILLVVLASWGWWKRVTTRPTAAELFVPLYAGLILVWPEVWSGDRFVLPLYPLLLLYAGESLRRVAKPLGPAGVRAVLSAGVLILLLPALPGWMSTAGQAAECRRIAGGGDPLRCNGPGFVEFRDAAAWAGENLPEGSIVLSRKPRLHYLFGGPSGRTFPFTRDPDQFLADADRIGAAYVLLDHVDSVSLFYLPAVISGRPLAFCHVAGWGGTGEGPGTDLFGILPATQRRDGGDLRQLAACPPSFRRSPAKEPVVDPTRIPRLVRRDEPPPA